MRKETSCGCVIFDKETHSKVLIVYEKRRDFWGFPKGHVESGETETQTALREVKEEVGIDVKILEPKFRYVTNYITENGQIDKTSIYYIAETIDEAKIKNQEAEIEDSKWATIDEAKKLLTYDNCKEVLNKACDDIKNLI